jgi:hypothetical protein
MKPRNERIHNDDIVIVGPADPHSGLLGEFPGLQGMPFDGVQQTYGNWGNTCHADPPDVGVVTH